MRFSAANIIIIKEGAMILGLLQKKEEIPPWYDDALYIVLHPLIYEVFIKQGLIRSRCPQLAYDIFIEFLIYDKRRRDFKKKGKAGSNISNFTTYYMRKRCWLIHPPTTTTLVRLRLAREAVIFHLPLWAPPFFMAGWDLFVIPLFPFYVFRTTFPGKGKQ